MDARIALQPAYVLHRTPFQNTSFIVDFFTVDYGRVRAVAKGVGLTTMNQHPSRQGSMAVSEALAQLGGAWDESDDSHLELQVDLKIRASTAPPPA